jgi:hypothetical protein
MKLESKHTVPSDDLITEALEPSPFDRVNRAMPSRVKKIWAIGGGKGGVNAG